MTPIEVLKAYYAAFNDKNWDAMADVVDDDVLHFTNQGPLRRGKTAFSMFMRDMGVAYNEFLTNLVLFSSDEASRVAAEYILNGVYTVSQPGLPPAAGQRYVLPGGAFFDVRDGLIRRIATYYNVKDWIDQVQEQTKTP